MDKKKDLIMVAVVTVVAIGLLLSVTALVRGVVSAVGIAFGG
jgi:predicted homoserine dehydrogenase-like protein